MLIEKTDARARVFNLNDATENGEYNDLLSDPAIKILEERWIKHTESTQEGRNRTEVTENHIFVKWERCSL
jgi:hypothetical protein